MPRTIKIDPKDPDAALAEAVAVMRRGGLVAFPTESFYALGADALNPTAVEKVFFAKHRRHDMPLPVIIHDKKEIYRYVKDLSLEAGKAIDKLMPGPATVIFHASDEIPENLTGGTGRVGVRVPEYPIATRLAGLMGGPITATSANLSGSPGLTSPDDVALALGGTVLELVLDGGETHGAPPSTIIDVTVCPPALIREGRVSKSRIEDEIGPLVVSA